MVYAIGAARGSQSGAAVSAFDAVDEPAGQFDPDLVLLGLVLDAVIDVGIVVDLDDEDAVRRLLDVDAVEAVADELRGAQADVDHRRRRLAERGRVEAALVALAVGAVADDLPMVLGHHVLADEQRLAAEHADAPVERGRHEGLGEQHVGVLEPFLGQRRQLLLVGDLLDAAREGRIGDLQHHREAERVGGADEIVHAADDHRRRHREAVAGQQLVQVDLVGAADHRDRDRR